MKFSLFEKIYGEDGRRRTIGEVAQTYEVEEETVKGIFAKRAHYQMMAALSSLHTKYPPNHLSALFLSSESLTVQQLSAQFKLPPCVIVRILLKSLYPQLNPTLVLRLSEELDSLDTRLRKEVEWAIKVDVEHAPAMDVLKNELGRAYEERIRTWLEIHQIPFYEEAEERAKGVPKTPDFRLLLPIAVQNNTSNSNNTKNEDAEWKVITWIESKAMFGDPKTDALYHREQFRPYWNRFGPGLVIYWFDFVEDGGGDNADESLIYKSSGLPMKVQQIN